MSKGLPRHRLTRLLLRKICDSSRGCLPRFVRPFQEFLISDSGMTLPLMAMSMVMITGMTGLAIDVSRAQLVQSKLQFSLDAAGLAAGSTVSTADLQNEVSKYLNANFNGYLGATIKTLTATADQTNTVITLNAQATLPATFLNIVDVETITVNATDQVSRSMTGLELVLVLDNTGSMANSAGAGVSKIQALKTAATTLVNTLFANNAGSTNKLWVGIVPFSQAVNIGTSHPTWLNTTYDATLTDWGPSGSWGGCVDARSNGEDITDDPPINSNTNTLFKQYYWISDNLNPDGVSNSGSNVWKTTRTRHGVTTTTYASPLSSTTAGPNYLCPQQVVPMTNNSTTLLNTINSMQAVGDTLINQGLEWGWNMLSPRWRGLWGGTMDANNLPLDYGAPGMTKVIVLLTDGENTVDNSAHGAYWFLGDRILGTTSSSTAVTTLNNRTLQICTAIKNKGVYIYTIALGTDPSQSALSMLQSCATANNYYFDSPSTSQLQGIFSAIGDSLASLRVSK